MRTIYERFWPSSQVMTIIADSYHGETTLPTIQQNEMLLISKTKYFISLQIVTATKRGSECVELHILNISDVKKPIPLGRSMDPLDKHNQPAVRDMCRHPDSRKPSSRSLHHKVILRNRKLQIRHNKYCGFGRRMASRSVRYPFGNRTSD